MEKKIRLYNAALLLLEASKYLKFEDNEDSDVILDMAEKYLTMVENWDLDREEIDKYKELLSE